MKDTKCVVQLNRLRLLVDIHVCVWSRAQGENRSENTDPVIQSQEFHNRTAFRREGSRICKKMFEFPLKDTEFFDVTHPEILLSKVLTYLKGKLGLYQMYQEIANHFKVVSIHTNASCNCNFISQNPKIIFHSWIYLWNGDYISWNCGFISCNPEKAYNMTLCYNCYCSHDYYDYIL